VGRSERKKLLGRSRSKWEDIVKLYLQDVGWWSMDWSNTSPDTDRWRTSGAAVMNLHIPQNTDNSLSIWEPLSFSRQTPLLGLRQL
jgi:hypothetical protein